MNHWTIETLQSVVNNFIPLTVPQKDFILNYMNRHFPPSKFDDQLTKRNSAIANMKKAKLVLNGAEQQFPNYTHLSEITPTSENIKGCAIVLTAGGEGERLRLSLLEKGVASESLRDFTKATYPLDNFINGFGALHINLAMIADLCKSYAIDIPVIITTGAEGSTTARVIPEVLKRFDNFGLNKIRLVAQEERLHFTLDEKIVLTIIDNFPYPITQPDETGGPLMKLKYPSLNQDSTLEWLKNLHCTKLLIIQGTAVYHKLLLPTMATISQQCDCLCLGILRNTFPQNDPYGTIVSLRKDNLEKTVIIEQDIRNEQTRDLIDHSGKYHLPFNTGFYAIDLELLANNDLPDYATPPKEIVPEIPRSPKVGYAATDVVTFAKKPLTLAIDKEMYAVLKNSDDIRTLGDVAKKFELEELCKKVARK